MHMLSRQPISATFQSGALYPTRVRRVPSHDSFVRVLGLRGMSPELWLVLAYIVVMGVGDLSAAKLGVNIGPVPVFLTDITLVLLLGMSLIRWPSRILYWVSEGVGAGPVGRIVWLLCIVATIYFVLAFPKYHIYAVRDLAIFCYSLFFPLTCFAIRDRRDAMRLMRYLTYSGVILAAMLLFQIATGVDVGLFGENTRFILGHAVAGVGSGDAGACSVFSLAALLAYVLFEHELYRFHILCGVVCFFALAATTSRAGVVGVALASAIIFLCAGPRYRIRYVLFAGFLVLLVFLSPLIPTTFPGAGLLQGLRLSLFSASNGPSGDPTAYFRVIRWRITFALWLSHPVFGVGFGRMLLPDTLRSVRIEAALGHFNMGMPHNTFLFLAARMGIIGLLSVVFCWLFILVRLFVVSRRTHCAEELATANILGTMVGFAMFVLFFERPMLNAVFWIVMAIGWRLIESHKAPAECARSKEGYAFSFSSA